MGKILVYIIFALGFVACSSKKIKEPPPEIVTEPMKFESQGSDSGKIDGLYTIHFEFDKSKLSSEAKTKLQMNATWIKNHAKVKILIEGHCDSTGSIEYNLVLGDRRAKITKEYLLSLGIPGERLSTTSFGKERPLVSGEDEASMAKNRRANFVVLEK